MRIMAALTMTVAVTLTSIHSKVHALPQYYADQTWDCLGMYDACMFFYGDDADFAYECEEEAQECNRDVVDSLYGSIDMWD